MRSYLFSYGRLQSPYAPPKTAMRFTRAYVRGLCWNRGDDPAITHVGDPSYPWVEGQRIEMDSDELPHIDAEEQPDFRRMKVNVRVGDMMWPAWIYVFKGPAPKDAHPISKWGPGGTSKRV